MKTKKPGALAIVVGAPGLSSKKGKRKPAEEEYEDDGEGSLGLAAAKQLLAAIKSGSASRVHASLQAHYDACAGADEEE